MSKLKIDKKDLFKYLKKALPLIGITIFVYLIYNIGTDKILHTFLRISPFHVILAASITFPLMMLYGLQWQYLLKKQNINIGFFKTLKIFLIGYFYGSISPGFIAQHIRVVYMKKATNEPSGKLFTSSVILATVNTLTVYIMAIVGAFLIINRYPNVFYAICIMLSVIVILCLFFIRSERGEKVFHFIIKLFIPKKTKHYFRGFVSTIYDDFPSGKDFVFPLILGILILIVMYTQIYILSLSLGVDIPFSLFIFLYPIATAVALLPITSAGLGTREATLIFLFSMFGVAPEVAVTLSLVGYLITGILPGFYGFLLSLTEAADKNELSELKSISK